MKTFTNTHGLTFEVQKLDHGRPAERWMAQVVRIEDTTTTDLWGNVHQDVTYSGMVAWLPTLKACKAWAATVTPSYVGTF